MIQESRKYRVTLLYLILSAILVLANIGDVSNWLSQAAIVVLAYMGGNAAEHWAKRGKDEASK